MFELTEDALTGIDTLAQRHHATKTAIVEALGRLGRTVDLPPEVVELAQRIDQERRSRR